MLFRYGVLFIKILVTILISSFLASGNFCHLPITFANSLDPDQDRQDVGPDLDPNCWTLLYIQNIQMAVLPEVRSALCAASQLPGEGPTDVEDVPASAR